MPAYRVLFYLIRNWEIRRTSFQIICLNQVIAATFHSLSFVSVFLLFFSFFSLSEADFRRSSSKITVKTGVFLWIIANFPDHVLTPDSKFPNYPIFFLGDLNIYMYIYFLFVLTWIKGIVVEQSNIPLDDIVHLMGKTLM